MGLVSSAIYNLKFTISNFQSVFPLDITPRGFPYCDRRRIVNQSLEYLKGNPVRSRSRTFKNRIYAQFARVGKALSSPKRLELLELLAQGERTVEGLSREASQTIANCSRHLQVLRQANLVETRKEGTYVYYRLADDGVSRFWLELRALAEERLAEVERVVRDYIELKDDFEPIGCSELLDRLRKGEVVVLDVRPEEEYRAGHLPGALSVPPGEVERRLASRHAHDARIADIFPNRFLIRRGEYLGPIVVEQGSHSLHHLLGALRIRTEPVGQLVYGLPYLRLRVLFARVHQLPRFLIFVPSPPKRFLARFLGREEFPQHLSSGQFTSLRDVI
ncbi:MAG: metalloregulator ArsR/SmtB family transcription factor [Nitrospirae bacterium]|nr:metalloregulator ArsR/SmtB family transcription factor [Nitrospirota bacterium]